MKGHWLDLVVGLLFFFAMGILGYTTIFKAQRFGKTKLYRVKFPRVYGLKEGSPVRCEGKAVGEVKKLALVEGYVEAVLEVSDAVTIYKRNSKINVTPFSPLGGRVVEITRGMAGSGELKPAKLVDGKLDETIHQGQAEGELLSALTGLINDNRKKIDEIVENVRSATERLREKTNLAGKILNDEDFAEQFDGIATHLNKASKSVEVVTGRLERGEGVLGELTVEGKPLQKNFREAVEKFRDTFDELSKVGNSMNEGKGLINVVLNDEEFANDWRSTSSNINKVTTKLAEGKGIMRLFSEEDVYENIKDITKEGKEIARKLNDPKAGAAGVLIASETAGQNLEDAIDNIAETSRRLNDGNAGVLGALISDEEMGKQTRRVFSEVERVIKEFRDSLEDVREQAPVNAFIGTVFSAF